MLVRQELTEESSQRDLLMLLFALTEYNLRMVFGGREKKATRDSEVVVTTEVTQREDDT